MTKSIGDRAEIVSHAQGTSGSRGAYQILENKLSRTVPEKPDLELLHEERNNIQHKYSNPSAEDAAFHVDRAVTFLSRFVQDELNIDMDEKE